MPTTKDDAVSESDTAAGFHLRPHFERFNQKDDVFRRSWWDERIRTRKSELFYETYREPLKTWRKVDGFTQKDYALRNAAWHVSDLFTRTQTRPGSSGRLFPTSLPCTEDIAAEQMDLGTPAQAATEIKRVGKSFGADLIGIAEYDERWMYVHKFSDMSKREKPQENPRGPVICHCGCSGHGLRPDSDRSVCPQRGQQLVWGIRTTPSLSCRSPSTSATSAIPAIASMNDTALAIPYAIKAGLGEYGRLGLLITKEFGPRVRLGKIFTNLPLAPDRPIRFGVKEFCETCPAVFRGLSGERHSLERPVGRNLQSVQHQRGGEMDGRWGKMFRLLGRPE